MPEGPGQATPGKVVPLGLMRVWAARAAERLREWQSGQIYFGQMTDIRTFVEAQELVRAGVTAESLEGRGRASVASSTRACYETETCRIDS
jgi:hypothetical protein